MPYDPALVQPMREELTQVGVTQLDSAEAVAEHFTGHKGTTLLVVNSVCGCAAGGARPGISLAIQHEKKPDHVVTVFAGQDLDATDAARAFCGEIPPSSPSFALFKDGEVVHFVPRHMIEGRDPKTIAWDLIEAFDKHCTQA